ncbi:DUF2161 domain-containing phosphodiesterase [Paenibacillus roseipurpureus]|uniref:DUF2161 family putative PD-(D/E)XK-type phosphodiesterase n=1 Tax=Paenibacillus roseopurpureus TaxID=2918901 RepID=A0AA96LPD0_9BACL|nr:DUF2161 family putative PD-(D/E)XK-type phosphodiesterase [Paenibacillus sp. MBLB1832]WNR43524.1 DUF2161 family putative PD-(D/E)XK-type phosphodiesterase [Paenibacillus sp. MBLB1832]
MPIQNETELYAPVKHYFEQRGYTVRGEVKHCDLVAIRGDEPPVIVELKKSFNIPLLVQAIDRLKLTQDVYVAFELPNKGKAPHRLQWEDIRRLCRMLGLGVLTVQFYKRKQPTVDLVCEPTPYMLRSNKRASLKLVTEFHERSGDYNVGGSNKMKLMTAYREKSLHCVHLLKLHGPLSPRQLREFTNNKAVPSLLQQNYYGWFIRQSRGIYHLTPSGEKALVDYAHVAASFPPSSQFKSE